MVVVKEGETIQYQVEGQLFKTPTAAAKHITKDEINGWRFWKIC